jgi:hypothetical protein
VSGTGECVHEVIGAPSQLFFLFIITDKTRGKGDTGDINKGVGDSVLNSLRETKR